MIVPCQFCHEEWPRLISEHILPAVRACGSLREIRWLALVEADAFAEVAELLEARRRGGRGGE